MKNFRVNIARSQREYADVIVAAPSAEVAEAYVDALQQGRAGDDGGDAYCDMVNNAAWNGGGSDTFDEDVLDVDEWEDEDEADVTVPEGWAPTQVEPSEPIISTIETATLNLLQKVAEDTRGLVECNCSYDAGTDPANRCDGSCTYSMAVRALAALKEAR